MNKWQSRSIHRISISLSSFGIVLLVGGIVVGWFAPWAGESIRFMHFFLTPLSILGDKIDINAFLGAVITALAVIIAVLIGYNASTLQIAGQLLSPVLVRAILLSLAPFLICWSVTTFVVLAYFLIPPTLIAQLVQLLLWFAAVVLIMIGYLWNLPWRLSGEHAAQWAIRELRNKPMNQWESTDGYSLLQTGVGTATARADLGAVRSITMAIGSFLASTQDRQGEMANRFDRERYRSLKNLLSSSAQNAASAPNAVAYYLGFVTAGVLLQGVAIGCVNDVERDLFSGLFRAVRNSPERLDPLWTGMRHGLCRKGMHGDPYMLLYWKSHRFWEGDDTRRLQSIAEALARFHTRCWSELGISFDKEKNAVSTSLNTIVVPAAHPALWRLEEVSIEAAGMLTDLYRDIAKYLMQEIVHANANSGNQELRNLPPQFLEAVHASVLQIWPAGEAEKAHHAVIEAYHDWRAEMKTLAVRIDDIA